MSTDQAGFDDYDVIDPDRDQLVRDLRGAANLVDGSLTLGRASEICEHDIAVFRDEFGSFEAAVVEAGVIADPEEIDLPQWAAEKLEQERAPKQLRLVARGRLKIPEWASGYDELVVRTTTNSRKAMHAPDLTAENPQPACVIGGRDTQSSVATERENLEGFYEPCDLDACRDWFRGGGE